MGQKANDLWARRGCRVRAGKTSSSAPMDGIRQEVFTGRYLIQKADLSKCCALGAADPERYRARCVSPTYGPGIPDSCQTRGTRATHPAGFHLSSASNMVFHLDRLGEMVRPCPPPDAVRGDGRAPLRSLPQCWFAPSATDFPHGSSTASGNPGSGRKAESRTGRPPTIAFALLVLQFRSRTRHSRDSKAPADVILPRDREYNLPSTGKR